MRDHLDKEVYNSEAILLNAFSRPRLPNKKKLADILRLTTRFH